MSSDNNAQVIRNMYDAFSRKDLNTVLDVFSEDATWNLPGAAPYAGRRHGREKIREFFGELDRLETSEQYDVIDILADRDKVVALGRERAMVKESGSRFEQYWVHVYVMRGGKIIEAYLHGDTHAVASAYGESVKERRAATGHLGITHPAYSGRTGNQESQS